MKKSNTFFTPGTILYAMTKTVLKKAKISYPGGVSPLNFVHCNGGAI